MIRGIREMRKKMINSNSKKEGKKITIEFKIMGRLIIIKDLVLLIILSLAFSTFF